ncbi:MAG: polysaccharide biosynthesis/export family protein [Chitinophagaceae bacterium]|nr:polysaccharide biosynthesis/export family protein [Chitinophagaceae bacterium]
MKNQTQPDIIHSPPCRLLFFIPLIFLLFSSCRTQKQLQYLQGPIDTVNLSKLNFPEPTIQKADVLSIVVYSDNPELTAFYNQQSSASTGTSGNIPSSTSTTSGYLVDNEGYIYFQTIGQIFVEGLTTKQLQDSLKEKLNPFLKNSYATIRILNKKFTVLGEVLKQGLFSFPSERVNILEALGLAGDITLYGLKDSIMVIRETNGKRVFGNLNVNDPNVLLSPYYYIQQNDIIIVKSTPKKPNVSDQATTRNLALVATIATILTSIAVIFNIFK